MTDMDATLYHEGEKPEHITPSNVSAELVKLRAAYMAEKDWAAAGVIERVASALGVPMPEPK
jgi:hypothetical protein